MRIGLVLLNRNEEISLKSLLPKINTQLFEDVFCVDGNSTDGSKELISQYGIRLLEQKSSGRGNAFKLAFKEAEDRNLDSLVFLSTDGNEDPGDLPIFRKKFESGFDLVIASRMMDGAVNEEDIAFLRPRKWANNLFAMTAWLIHGRGKIRLTDPINGYRGITLKSWSDMNISAESFDVEYQTSLRAYQLDIKYVEFPTHEGQRVGGKSGATPFKTTWLLVKVLVLQNKRKFY